MTGTPSPIPLSIGRSKLYHGDSTEILRSLPENHFHAVVTDPPYGLTNTDTSKVAEAMLRWSQGEREWIPGGTGFMGKAWDRFVPPPAAWDAIYRVMKPGAHMFVFAGARTSDLMSISLRLAGFEIRDMFAWIRGYGMQKTAELSKQLEKAGHPSAADWEGWYATVKPAIEPMILARKPLDGTLTNTLLTHGTGALHNDALRVPHRNEADLIESTGKNRHGDFGTSHGLNQVYGDFGMLGTRGNYDGSAGRLPTNVILSSDQAEFIDQQSGITTSKKSSPRAGASGQGWGATHTGAEYDDIGGASRFFHIIDERLEQLDTHMFYASRAPSKERPKVNGVQHTTVKPLELMRKAVQLITPPGGRLLDPFAGSGSTQEAASQLGFENVGIELMEEHLPLIEHRMRRVAA